MVGYWTRFARAGQPERRRGAAVAAYTAANDLFMSLEPPTPVVKAGFAADHKCDVLGRPVSHRSPAAGTSRVDADDRGRPVPV